MSISNTTASESETLVSSRPMKADGIISGNGHDESREADGELLKKFLKSRDNDDFRELVVRFGSLVYGIALRSLHDRHAAEDAFQATFLILARDGRMIRNPASIGAWLHGVAVRVSKRMLARRQRECFVEDPMQSAEDDTLFDELNEQFEHQLLDEELQRLPEVYRAPLVLHFLEGKSYDETARALETTEGAIRGRLQRGKSELRLRLMRRGVEISAVLAGMTLWQSVAQAAVRPELISKTVLGGMATVQGIPYSPTTSPEAVHLATKELTMLTKTKILCTCALIASTTVLGWFAHAELAKNQHSSTTPQEPIATEVFEDAFADESIIVEAGPPEFEDALALAIPAGQNDTATDKEAKPQLVLKYGDGKPDGKKSIAGTGEMIQFTLPDTSQQLRSLKIHCARYGYPRAPDEDVEISVVSEDTTELIHTELVSYSKFRRGESRWTTLGFEESVDVPETFWVIIDFNAERTKGVYVSYDTSTEGKHSRTGVPGGDSKEVNFGGDWMIQAVLTKPE